MATVKVIAGDFLKRNGGFQFGHFSLYTEQHSFMGETIPLAQLETLEPASEESVVRVGGAAGWGLAGALALGPVGLLAGLVLGGRGKDVTFIATFRDGRKLLGSTDSKTYQGWQTAMLARSMDQGSARQK